MKKIGLCSITFRDKSVDEIIELALENGLNFIEWGGDIHLKPGDFEEARRIKALCDKNNILYSYGSYYKYKDTDDFDLVLETAAALTTKDIRIWAKRIGSADISEEDYKDFVEKTKVMADKAKEKNIRLNFEDHRVTLTDTTKSARKLLDDIARDNVYIYWQPQADDSEEERIEAIKTLHDKITNVHVFNWDQDFNRYPLIEAKDEWKSYIKNLGGDRAYLLEFVRDDKIEQFKEDAKVLKNMLGG